jgi:hypothetical protein
MKDQREIFPCITLSKKLSQAARAVLHRRLDFTTNLSMSRFLAFIIDRPEFQREVVLFKSAFDHNETGAAVADASSLLTLLVLLRDLKTLSISEVLSSPASAVFSAIGHLCKLKSLVLLGPSALSSVYVIPSWAHLRSAIFGKPLQDLCL